MTHMVIRGQKIISTSLVSDVKSITVHLHTEDQIYGALQKLGVQYIVVEDPLQTPKIPAYEAFRDLLNDKERFVLRKVIPLHISSHSANRPTALKIYEDRNPAPVLRDQMLDLHVPAAGRTYDLKLGDIIGNRRHDPRDRKP